MTPAPASAASRDAARPDGPPAVLYRAYTITPLARADDMPADDARIPVAISSEAPVERTDWWTGERFVEVLSHAQGDVDLSYARDGLPFCRDHDLSEQIGLLEDVTVDDDRRIRGMLRQGNHPDAAWLFADMRAGIRKKVSIGYIRGDTYEQDKPPKGQLPTRTYRGWLLYEASTVTVPADYEVGIGRHDARGVAAQHSTPATEGTALQETRMSDTIGGMAPAPVPAAAPALSREAELAALAQQHDAQLGTQARLAGWILSGQSADQVRAQIMEEYRTRQPQAPLPSAPKVEVGAERETQKPWTSFTEFMRAVKRAADGVVEPRLAATRGIATGMGVGQDSDGGFMIPEQYAEGIVTRAFTGGTILSRVRRVPVSGNTYKVALVDETSRANGSRWGGIRAFRIGENDATTASKPKIRQLSLDVTKKLAVLAYVTEEQLEDAPATDAMLTTAMTEEITFAAEREIWEGIGGAEALGIANSGALVTVTKENAQTAATVVAANVTKMNARLWAGSHNTAAWFVNQEVLAQLPLMSIGQQPVWLPPSGLVGSSPFGTLLGKPVFVVEYAAALGTAGDICLYDLNQYLVADKARSALARSMHVRFVNGEEAFRIIYRMDGAPMWNNTLTPFKGAAISPFITLEARA